MQTLNVALGSRSYPIHIGAGLLARAELIVERLPQKKAAIVTNSTVAPLYLARAPARAGGARRRAWCAITLPDGEQHKNWETLNRIFDALLEHRCERGTTLIALGGGVVGDLAGFAAAVYQRGVPFIQVPTTLLAQVDSAVGGKTAINHPLGKNMIGAFYQPRAVIADTDTLATLPAARARGRAGGGDQVRPDPRPRVLRVAREQHGRGCVRARPKRSPTRSSAPAPTRPRSSRATSAKAACARCSTSATPSATRSRPGRATARGCTARRSPPAWCSRRGSRSASA